MKALLTLVSAAALMTLSACSEPAVDKPIQPVKSEQESPPSREIAGITIGQSANLPECTKKKSYGQISYETFPKNVPCWTHRIYEQGNLSLSQADEMPQEGSAQVHLGRQNVPEGVNDYAEILIIDGKIEQLKLETFGSDHQLRLLALLTEKWGSPTVNNIQELQNGFGARYKGIEAQWPFEGMTVAFFGVLTKPDDGLIIVGSSAAIAHQNEPSSEHAKSF